MNSFSYKDQINSLIKNKDQEQQLEPEFDKFISEEELEQFLCLLGMQDLLRVFLSKGLNSIEKLTQLEKFGFSKNVLPDQKKEIIICNINYIFDKINSYYNNEYQESQLEEDVLSLSHQEKKEETENSKFESEKPSFLTIIKQTIYDFKGITLTKEILMQSFKLKNKPSNYLPKDFKDENITADKLYASFLQDKKICFIDNLEGFRNLRHLYLNNNKLQILTRLNFPNLMIFELSNNFIRKIENLDLLINLEVLNLEKNCISKLENIQENLYLDTINLNKQALTKFQNFEIDQATINLDNRIKNLLLENNNFEDASKLVIFPYLKKLKVNNNKIYDLTFLIEGLKPMIDLEVLFVASNPFTETTKSYRDVIVIRCPNILELDDKTVTNNEKLYVNSLYARKFKSSTGNKQSGKAMPLVNQNKQLSNLKLNLKVNKFDINEERKFTTYKK